MKADLSPKYVHKINESIVLWFEHSNRYVVTSKSTYPLIKLFLRVENQSNFIDSLSDSTQIEHKAAEDLYLEISNFLEDANTPLEKNHPYSPSIVIPECHTIRCYDFDGTTIKVNFQTDVIESLIHPQIEHHLTHLNSNFNIEFDIFKTGDTLQLFKNKKYLGSYSTESFHFLQGKFALELTNAIHNTQADKWIATFHASTVTNNSEAIMIVGDSGNGKSTLSALLMAHGFDVLTDDFSPLYKDMHIYRYPAAISIKKGAFHILEVYLKDFDLLKTHTNGPKKVNLKYLPPSSKFSTSKSNFPCSTIVSVKFDSTKPSELTEVSIQNILETLIPESWISPDDTHALQFLNWLENVKCYELCYRDNDFAISKFKSLFDI